MSKPSQIGLSVPLLNETDGLAVAAALQANWITAGGPYVSAFERDLKHYLNTKNEVVALNSGTAALHLALILAGVKPGDYVICQTMTYVATANPIAYLKAIPVFVDSEQTSYNLDPNYVEEAIHACQKKGKKPAAIIAVHSYGIPCDIERLAKLAAQHDIPLIEDAAEALGSQVNGSACGVFGDYGIFSFNGNKIITTGGGGALICKSAADAAKARHLATQAKTGARGFEHDAIGYNYAMPGLNAALGSSQLKDLQTRIEAKRKIHHIYLEICSAIQAVELIGCTREVAYANYWLNALRFTGKPSALRNPKHLQAFLSDAGIESRLLWKPLHLQGIYKEQEYFGADTAEALWKSGLCLPSGAGLTKTELKKIKNALKAYFSS